MKKIIVSILLAACAGCSTTDIITPSGYRIKRTNVFINPEIRLHAKSADGTEIDLGWKQTNSAALEKSLDLANALAK